MRTCVVLSLKIYLFFFNIFLWLVSVGILGGVAYYFFTADQYKGLSNNTTIVVYTIVPLILIVLIALMLLLISVLGLISACFDVKILIAIYGILLAILVTSQVAGGILVIAFRDPVLNELNTGFATNLPTYNESEGFRITVDRLQSTLQCCGFNDSNDWLVNVGIDPPLSCCREPNCVTTVQANIYTDGCRDKLINLIMQSTAITISIAVILALVQYSGVVIAFILACCCRKEDSDDLIEAKRNLPKY